ncbi:MAG TPA: cyclic nucleotide-binding domain-containing protein [Rhodospirillaceae bacterium]|nr:cyclic nucleotide-binding domain-containing protein [Rhodospirillaceae bacterium]
MAALSEGDLSLVRRAPLFSEIDGAALEELLDSAFIRSYPDGGLVFGRGDAADRFFIVMEGRVNLFALTEKGDQSIIEVIESGQSFAEGAIFAGAQYPLNAEAAVVSRLLEIPAQPFLRRLAAHQGLAAQLLASLARWERHLTAEIADLKSRSPVQRLGAYLLARAAPGEGGGAAFDLPLSKSELASRLGITPESLSRALKRLAGAGVATHGRTVVIDDVAALRQFCRSD